MKVLCVLLEEKDSNRYHPATNHVSKIEAYMRVMLVEQ